LLTYFDRFAQVAEQRLRVHQDPVLAAADAYSYMHLILVAGIIVFAVGVKYMIIAADVPLSDPARLALCGGVVTYLVGHVAFRLRMVGELGYEKLIVTGSLMLLFAVSDGLRAWILAGVIAVLLGAMCAIESSRR